MVNLKNLSENEIRNFAGNVIFNRGLQYFKDDMVHEFEYINDSLTINAEVYGSYGDYDVEITEVGDAISAFCSCPYDGYPCKHIVAVLLYFIRNKKDFQKKALEEKKANRTLENELEKLSKSQLIALILTHAKKNAALHRELSLHFAIDTRKIVIKIKKRIEQSFPDITTNYYSTSVIIKELRKILKEVETSDVNIKCEIYWAIIDRILYELNEYGMSDYPLEEFVIKVMDMIVDLLIDNPQMERERDEVYANLKEYSKWGNCGIVDHIEDAAERIHPDFDS